MSDTTYLATCEKCREAGKGKTGKKLERALIVAYAQVREI